MHVIRKGDVRTRFEAPSPAPVGRRAVLKYHLRDGCLLGELLTESAEGANGYVLDLGRGPVSGDLERISKRFCTTGDRYVRSLREGVPVLKVASFPSDRLDLAGPNVFDADTARVEYGVQTADSREFFFSGGRALNGTVRMYKTDSGTFLNCASRLLPTALSYYDAKQGVTPPEGASCLPRSLETVVPPEYRYWLLKGEDARRCREALIDSGFFSTNNVLLVEGELRRVVTKHFLYMPPATVQKRDPAQVRLSKLLPPTVDRYFHPFLTKDWRGALAKADVEGSLVVLSPPAEDLATVHEIVEVAKNLKAEWLIDVSDSWEARAALAKIADPFTTWAPMGPNHLFAASYPLPSLDGVIWVAKEDLTAQAIQKPFAGFKDFGACVGAQRRAGHSDESAHKICGALQRDTEKVVVPDLEDVNRAALGKELSRAMRLVKTDLRKAGEGEGQTEQRLVYGIVLEPETVDAQQDIYSAQEIEQAAHRFMEEFQNAGLMHESVVNEKVKIVESYIAPADFQMGDQLIKAGTWMMVDHILDDALWDQVKTGGLTGFSIGGTALRMREPAPVGKADGNPKPFKKTYQGIGITVDRPKGFVQKGTAPDGAEWTRTYLTDYGFIPKTEGGDGEDLDVFLGPEEEAPYAYWVMQKKFDGSFDEYKVFLGYENAADVKKVYVAHVPAQLWGGVFATPVGAVKSLLGMHPDAVTKAFADLTGATPSAKTEGHP